MSMYKPDFIHANESFRATFDRHVFMMGLKEVSVLTRVAICWPYFSRYKTRN